MLFVFGELIPDDVAAVINAAGFAWKSTATLSDAKQMMTDDADWQSALVLANKPEKALEFCQHARHSEHAIKPLLLAIEPQFLRSFEASTPLYDEFIVLPLRLDELQLRLERMMHQAADVDVDVVHYDGIVLNLSTYQATVNGRALDMTYMEYELLRHFVTNPNRVLTREELLRKVWRYEYYGGARTVDVHVRRLRAKLGDEQAALIQTIRSVGYIFGDRARRP
jgi:two-component system, OmpR family, alkaline phosphatase synthesis response regulator PhoP